MRSALRPFVAAAGISVLVGAIASSGRLPAEASRSAGDGEHYTRVTHAASRSQAGNRSSTLLAFPPSVSSLVLAAYEIDGDGGNGPPRSIQPGVAAWDPSNGEVAEGQQINAPPNGHYNVVRSNAGHDAAYLVAVGHGDVMVPYGASSTYFRARPPAAWSCLGAYYCMPFKLASLVGKSGAAFVADLAASAERNMPTIGLSEGSFATADDVTAFAGQQHGASPSGDGGSQGYVTFHSTASGAGYFDSAAGPWDFHRPISTATDGLQTWTLAPKDNAYFEFAVRSVDPDRGSGGITVTIEGQTCSLAGMSAAGMSPAVAADAYVSYFMTSTDSGCAELRRRYNAVRPTYDASHLSPGATIGIDVKSGDVTQLPRPPAPGRGIVCSEAIDCGDGARASLDLRNTGFIDHKHFLWGGLMRLGGYFYELMDVQQTTGSWYGSGHNSLAGALACFRSEGPRSGAWTWTDCTGRNPFVVAPGVKPAYRLGTGAQSRSTPSSPYLIKPPRLGYPPSMIPFYYDYSMEAQPEYTRDHGGPRYWPVVSALSATLDTSHNLWMAYQCLDADGRTAICYLELDTSTGETDRIGFVDKANGPRTTLGTLELSKDVRGGLVLGALVGYGSRWGCSSGPCAIVYRLTPGARTWEKTIVHSFGGRDWVSATGVVTQSYDGSHLLFQSYDESEGPSLGIFDFAIAPPAPR